MAVWSIVNSSQVIETLRFDADYYQPKFLAYEKEVGVKGGLLSNYISNIIQPAEFIREYVDKSEGAAFWRAQNVRPGYINAEDVEYVSWSTFSKVPNAHVKEGDILITRTGANAGDCAVVPEISESIAVSSHTLRLIPKTVGLGYTIGTFFASGLGRDILFRTVSGSSRPQITKEILLSIRVPNFSAIETEITETIKLFNQKREQSKVLHAEAEALLLHELGLDTLDLSTQKTYVANFSETVEGDRFDAEYFQPKYYRLLNSIRQCGFDYKFLESLIEPIRNGFDYREFTDEGTPYVRVGDIRNGKINLDNAETVPITQADIFKNIALQVGDVLFTRKGTFGNSAVVRQEQDHAIISSEIMLLRILNNSNPPILPDYLSLFLSSVVGYQQVERKVHGVAFFSISQPDLAKVLVVVPPISIQENIVEKIQTSFLMEQEAERLLQKAKRRVEQMILGEYVTDGRC